MEYEWSGTLTKSMFENVGLWEGGGSWFVGNPMTGLDIGNTVTSIGDWAFSCCSGLTSVTIGDGVTSIGSSAFDGCSFSTITIHKNKNGVKNLGLDYLSEKDESVEITVVCSDGTLTIGFDDMGTAYWKD